MTQDYEPIKLALGVPEPEEYGVYLVFDAQGHIETLVRKVQVLYHTPRWDVDEEFYEWYLFRREWSGYSIQSLADHDAQVRAEALALTDNKWLDASESIEAIFEPVFEGETDDYIEVIRKVLKVLREEPQQ